MAEVDLRCVDDAGQIEGAVLLLQEFGEVAEPFALQCVESLVLKHASYSVGMRDAGVTVRIEG